MTQPLLQALAILLIAAPPVRLSSPLAPRPERTESAERAAVRPAAQRGGGAPPGGKTQPGGLPSLGATQVNDCLVFLIDDVQSPALEAGALAELLVKEGDLVTAGQLLARIDDQQVKLQKRRAELERNAALAKASDDIEVRFSVASLAYTNAELTRLLALERRNSGAVTAQEIEKAKLARQRDELQIDRSKLELTVAKMTADVHQAEVDFAESNVARRQIVAPLDGEIVSILHEKGEWLNIGEPVLQIVRMDTLRVEGLINATDLNVDEITGKTVAAEVDLARGRRERFVGKITYVSPLVTAGGKYRVRAEVENRRENKQWLLRPGMNVTLVFEK